jgi:hypothetical protein
MHNKLSGKRINIKFAIKFEKMLLIFTYAHPELPILITVLINLSQTLFIVSEYFYTHAYTLTTLKWNKMPLHFLVMILNNFLSLQSVPPPTKKEENFPMKN